MSRPGVAMHISGPRRKAASCDLTSNPPICFFLIHELLASFAYDINIIFKYTSTKANVYIGILSKLASDFAYLYS
jgi:hypothetical protein